MFHLDIYQEISNHLSVKDFLNLTSCNSKLRKLYNYNLIWKRYLKRDFNYDWHPEYTLERYKACYYRKYEELKIDDPPPTDILLQLIPIPDEIKPILNFKDWGLDNKDNNNLFSIRFVTGFFTIYSLIGEKFNDNFLVLLVNTILSRPTHFCDPHNNIYNKYCYAYDEFFGGEEIKIKNFVEKQKYIKEHKEKFRKIWLEVGFKKCW